MLKNLNVFVRKNPFLTVVLATAFSGFGIWVLSLLLDSNPSSDREKPHDKIQIQGLKARSIPMATSGPKGPSLMQSDTAYTRLEIVDLSIDGNTADFKLKNSGTDSAFLTRLLLYLRVISYPPYVCSFAGFASYDLEVIFPDTAYTTEGPFILRGKPLWGNEPIGEVELSQVVPPRGVDRFKVNFKFFSRAPICHPDLFEGRCDLIYDNKKILESPKFKIEPQYYER